MSTVRIQIRRGLADDWTSVDPALAAGEIGLETDTNKFKIGTNGTAIWSTLPYANVPASELANTLGDYVLITDIGAQSGVAGLDTSKNLLVPGSSIIIEGATDNTYETTLIVTDPTADRTITFPNASGTVALTSDITSAVNSIIDSAPGALDTLNEIAAALNDDANAYSTIMGRIDSELITVGNTFLTQATATSTYLTQSDAAISYLTQSDASDTYLTQIDAGNTYVTPLDVSSNYLSQSDATSTYLTQSNASSTYLSQSTAGTTYLTKSDATSDYLTKSDGASQISTAVSDHSSDTTNIHGISDTAALATKTYADNAVSTHESDTTSVHGIADTSALATKTYADNSATTAAATVTKTSLGLENVTNTSDANKPVSTAQQTALDAKLNLSGGTMTGDLTLSGAPTSSLHAATKAYVDNVSIGLNFHQAVHASTSTNITTDYNNGTDGLGATLTAMSNGAIGTIDGHQILINERVLVKAQTDAKQNGIYYVSNAGSAGSKWVLTRALDADNSPTGEIANGDFCFVQNGATNGGYGYLVSTTGTITIGTTDITYTQFNAGASVIAGTGLSEPTAGTFAIDETYTATKASVDLKAPISAPTFTGLVTLSGSGIAFADGTQTKEGVVSRTPIVQKTASYTLSSLTERDSLIEVSSSSGTTITIPTNSAIAYPIGTSLDILQTSTGQVTIVGDTGVTVNATPGLKLRTQWSSATLFKRAENTWVVYGDLTA